MKSKGLIFNIRKAAHDVALHTSVGKRIIRSRRLRSGLLKTYEQHCAELEVAEKVLLPEGSDVSGLFVGLVRDSDSEADIFTGRVYYPKYERFLKNNGIRYEYFDVHRGDWQQQAQRYNAVIWHTDSSYCAQTEAAQKIFTLSMMGIPTLPSSSAVTIYEDKVMMHYFYKAHNLPEIPTFVSNSREDALRYIEKCPMPIVSKVATGSTSKGVSMLRSRADARKFVERVFSDKGSKIPYYPYLRQKDYVLFQQFVRSSFDLRIIVVGESLFGYYRYPRKGDFRASGSGNYVKKAIPAEAMDIAWRVKECYGTECLATDFVYSESDHRYYIIESSIFIGVDTAMQLEVDGVAGRYVRRSEGVYDFQAGKYWIQELTLDEFFTKRILNH